MTPLISAIAANVRQWYRGTSRRLRATRKLIRDTYARFGDGSEMGDKNGYELNTAATVAVAARRQGGFPRDVVRLDFGWDADNNAATGGAIMGVMKGKRRTDAEGWNIKDVYRNTIARRMPDDETITLHRLGESRVHRLSAE